jgi:hypothetical protein
LPKLLYFLKNGEFPNPEEFFDIEEVFTEKLLIKWNVIKDHPIFK